MYTGFADKNTGLKFMFFMAGRSNSHRCITDVQVQLPYFLYSLTRQSEIGKSIKEKKATLKVSYNQGNNKQSFDLFS